MCVLSEPLLSSLCFTHQDELLSPEKSRLTTSSMWIWGRIFQIWQMKSDVFFSFLQLWSLKGGRGETLAGLTCEQAFLLLLHSKPERLQSLNKKQNNKTSSKKKKKKRKQGMYPGLHCASNLAWDVLMCLPMNNWTASVTLFGGNSARRKSEPPSWVGGWRVVRNSKHFSQVKRHGEFISCCMVEGVCPK